MKSLSTIVACVLVCGCGDPGGGAGDDGGGGGGGTDGGSGAGDAAIDAAPVGPAIVRVPVGPGLDNAGLAAGMFPPRLSQTGVFSDLAALTPHPALIPYAVNTEFWSDGAAKQRWVAVPNDGPPYAAAERVAFKPAGLWTFPIGTVTVKHFELVLDDSTGARKRLETRVGVRLASGAFAGASYRWRADHGDADLVTSTITEQNTVVTGGVSKTRTHTYPSPTQCAQCHRTTAGFGLALRTAQLNRELAYPSGVVENELRAWGEAELFTATYVEANIPTYLHTVPITDTSASLETRARSYFEANCSPCHHPGGPNETWDARFSTPLASQNIVGSKVKPGDPAGSGLYQRMSYATIDTPATASKMMPPLAKNHVDVYALDVVEKWILSL